MSMNGRATAELEFEAAHYGQPEAAHYGTPEQEEEWETPEAPYATEDEWESLEGHEQPEAVAYGNSYAGPAMEDEWETPEGAPFANPYAAPEYPHASPEHPYASPEMEDEWATHEATGYAAHELEDEWESPETYEVAGYANPYVAAEDERDQFLPFLAPLAAKALPMLAKFALPAVKKLIPFAKRAVSNVVRNVMGGAGRPAARPAAPAPLAVRRPTYARPATPPGRPGWSPALGRTRRATVSNLLRQLSAVLGEGESATAELEAQFFGANEFEGELAGHEAAHEAALTEVLAAEAAHTASEAEAEALLGAALPVTIRIMGGTRPLRMVTPTLAQANARLVRSIRRSGPAGSQLLRTVPSIQRRTVASLRAAQRGGRPITPALVARVMAGHSARVLGTPRICGRALIRNTAIRQGTVAPAGRRIQPRRQFGY